MTEFINCVSYGLGGAFLLNAVPHLASGTRGEAFQTPFASPPGKGLSSSAVNVVWGIANLLFAYLLVLRVGVFNARSGRHIVSLFAGFFLSGLINAKHFGPLHGGENGRAKS